MKTLKKHMVLYFLVISLILSALTVFWSYKKNDEKISLKNQGETAFSRREYKKAVIFWKAALKHNPDNVDLYMRLEKAYWRLAKWKKAEQSLISALNLNPEAYRARIELARIFLIRGDINAARNQAVKLSAISSKSPDLHVLWGDINILENKINKALTEYKKAMLLSSGETTYLLKLAACLHTLKKNHKAEIYFDLARDKKKLSVDDLMQFADYYDHIKDYTRAEKILTKAIQREPEAINIRIRLADIYISTRQFKKALSVLERIIQMEPGNRDVEKTMANIFINLNQFKKADRLLENLKKKIPENDFQMELLQGKFWLYQGKAAFAAIHLQSAVEMAPGLAMGYYYLSLAYLKSGQENLAENSLKSVLILDPDNSEATMLIAGILYKKGRYLISLKYLDRLIKKDPETYETHLLKGLNLLKLGSGRKAAKSIMNALAIDPVNPSAWFYLGIAFETAGENIRAIDSYARALSLNPNLAEAAYDYSEILIKTQKNKALDTVKKFLKGRKKTQPLYYALVRTAMALGQNKLAEKYLNKAISIGKMEPYYLAATMAKVQISMGHNEKARKILEEYTMCNPHRGDGWIGLASYYRNMGFPNKAITILERAKKRLPDSSPVLANLAWLYLESGANINLGLDLAKKAYEHNPDDPGTTDTLGWAYYKKGNYLQAGWIFSEMKKKYPENWLILYHMGLTLYRQGKIVQAKGELNQARILAPTEDKKDNITAMLSEIQNERDSNQEESVNFNKMDINKPLKFSAQKDQDILTPQWEKNPDGISFIKK